MDEVELLNIIKKIFNHYHLGIIESCNELKHGFNRLVFDVNNKYVLKICINQEKESGIKREIEFYNHNQYEYCPELIVSDTSKKILPYIYTIEEKIMGKNLFDIWTNIDNKSKEKILFKFVEVLKKIHKRVSTKDYNVLEILQKFDILCKKSISKNIFSLEEINYLRELKPYMAVYLKEAKIGYIHGDLHFNNIFWINDEIKLIDFENYGIAPIDKEFDTINRMVRDPNSFLSKDNMDVYHNPQDYTIVMDYLKSSYPEICNQETYVDRLLIYDCLNSLKWIYYYPDYERYYDVLFQKSKKLLR